MTDETDLDLLGDDVDLAMDKIKAEVLASAQAKARAGETLTGPERTALKRYAAATEERLRWQYYASIPQKHWRQMSGRAAQILHEQAERYGLPFGGEVVNLPLLAKAIHDFLAKHCKQFAMGVGDDPMMASDGSSPALERYREERAALARLDRLEREGKLLPRDDARQGLARMAAIIRNCGETLQRQFGPTALEILNEALNDFEQEVDRGFGEVDAAGDTPTAK